MSQSIWQSQNNATILTNEIHITNIVNNCEMSLHFWYKRGIALLQDSSINKFVSCKVVNERLSITLLLRLIFLACLVVNSNPVLAHKQLKLIFAIDLLRHGDRTPSAYLPGISKIWTKEEIGQLTALGEKQAISLGKNFKNYYINKMHLLPKKFNPDLVYVRSTNFQRTKKTARSVLKGMFPIHENKIDIFVPPTKQDFFNYRNKDLSIFKKAVRQAASSNPMVEKELQKINHTFGTKFSEPFDLIIISDVIQVSEIYNLPLAKPLSKRTKQKIVALGDELMLKSYTYPNIMCLHAKESVLHIADILESHHKKIFSLYVAHDVNTMAITSLLNFSLEETPSYLSDLRFEIFLNTDNNKKLVKMSIDGEAIKLCQSSQYCPIKEFIQTLKKNVDTKCKT